MKFLDWMKKVDQAISNRVGLTSADLSDWYWKDRFDDGASPQEAAEEFLEEELEEMGFEL